MARSAPRTGGSHRLLKRFLLLLLPVFLIASIIVLQALGKFTFGDERNQIVTRIGNLAARSATALNRLPPEASRPQVESVLALILADPAIKCAVVMASDKTVLATAPVRVGCTGAEKAAMVEVPLAGTAGRGLFYVKYDLHELEERSSLFKLFTILALFGSLLVATVASWFSFRTIVGRPVKALLNAIDMTNRSGNATRVAYASDDELGTVVSAFNGMQDQLAAEAVRNRMALRRLDYIYNDTPALMFSLDREGLIQTASGHWLEATGWQKKDVAGAPLENFLVSADGNCMEGLRAKLLVADEPLHDLPLELRCKDERRMAVLLSSVPDIDDGNTACLCVLSDISGLKAAQMELRRQAITDHLTGLPNRHGLFEHLTAMSRRSDKVASNSALLFIDLDNFKAINDTLGHAAGDELLRAAAGRIRNCISERDVMARLGGDEFAIALHDLREPADAQVVAHRIIMALSNPFSIGEAHPVIGASIGTASFNDSGNIDDILRFADLAMYQSKQSGKNCVSQYNGDLTAKVVARDLMVRKIRDALANDRFRLFLQPIMDIRTMRVAGAEALLRMECPNDGLISPGEIIKVAEEAGLIGEITAWSIAEAIRIVSENSTRFQASGRYLAVNLSPRQITREFMTELASRLRARPEVARCMVFEITETALFKTGEDIGNLLSGLRKTGARIALDDFGTGYSSLRHVQRFTVDTIKLDRSFVGSLDGDDEDARRRRALIKATAALADELGISIVAEGIEDEETLVLLKEFGVKFGQGFLFSVPLPVPFSLQWMEAFAPGKRGKPGAIKLVG